MKKSTKVKGIVILMQKNFLDFQDMKAAFLDRVHEGLGMRVSLQLISATRCDPENEQRGKLGRVAYLKNWIAHFTPITATDTAFEITFVMEEELEGIPGGFIIKNHHHSEFYLKSLTLNNVPGAGRIHFVCDSWVYPTHFYNYNRVVFSNKNYLPRCTPEGLIWYREQELVNLRGNGSGELKHWERVYDYALYNDEGDPDKGADYARPILGGSKEYPYPRRGRTGRPPTKTDPKCESRISFLKQLDIYVPRDERFQHLKMADIVANGLKSIIQVLVPEVKELWDGTPNEFESYQDVLNLYEGGIKFPRCIADTIRKVVPLELVKELLRTDGERFLKYPTPQVIQEDKFAWRTDEEFAREMLAGLNPVCICLLQEFPPISKLDRKEYGDQTSRITKEHIEKNLERMTVDEAREKKKLFILDHHDILMPYLNRINSTGTKTYATRTLLFLKEDGTLKPLAIELSLPHPQGEQHGAVSKIYTPAEQGIEGSVWQLAKAYAAVNDSGVHQLVSHWLKSHAAIEPFVIATNRQLSVLHPIYKLLHPHFRYTMNINAIARQILINAGGLLERTVFPARFSGEMSAVAYKDWVFPEQALPADLIKRGMAVPDSSHRHGMRLLIEDYPYAVDGLEIWYAIEKWVQEYCSYYYSTDEVVQGDVELQSWWRELRDEGHGDKKDEPWWPKMQTLQELTLTCTIIMWVTSAFHAALNFGQYAYAAYNPNRPSISRRFMPEPGTPEYDELEENPDLAYLKTITSQLQTLLGVSVIELLSKHSSDEVYLGQRDTQWTFDAAPKEAFEKFREKLIEIENRIMEMNKNKRLKNRFGPVKVPYTLLYPNTSDYTGVGGLTGRGIPNSISI